MVEIVDEVYDVERLKFFNSLIDRLDTIYMNGLELKDFKQYKKAHKYYFMGRDNTGKEVKILFGKITKITFK